MADSDYYGWTDDVEMGDDDGEVGLTACVIFGLPMLICLVLVIIFAELATG